MKHPITPVDVEQGPTLGQLVELGQTAARYPAAVRAERKAGQVSYTQIGTQ